MGWEAVTTREQLAIRPLSSSLTRHSYRIWRDWESLAAPVYLVVRTRSRARPLVLQREDLHRAQQWVLLQASSSAAPVPPRPRVAVVLAAVLRCLSGSGHLRTTGSCAPRHSGGQPEWVIEEILSSSEKKVLMKTAHFCPVEPLLP